MWPGQAGAWQWDAATFAVAAALRAGMRFPDLPPVASTGMLRDLREGWRDFISRRWFWTIVLALGLVVAVSTAAISVLGPVVAHDQLGGARSWGIILAAYAAGTVLGGIIMLSFQAQRILLAAMLPVPALSVFLFALAVPLPVAWDAATALLAGGCLEVFWVSWATAMQQESRQPSCPACPPMICSPASPWLPWELWSRARPRTPSAPRPS